MQSCSKMSEEYLKYLDESHYHDTLNDDVNDSINEVLEKKCKYKIPDHCTAKELKNKRKKKNIERKIKKMLEGDILY